MNENKKEFDEIFCFSCGKIIKKESEICVYCGVKNKEYSRFSNRFYGNINIDIQDISPLNRAIVLFLCIFVGWLGVHRFYVRRVISGMLYLFTFGIFGIGVIFDLFLIIIGNFRDKNNKVLINW